MFKIQFGGKLHSWDVDVDGMVAQLAALLNLQPEASVSLFDVDSTLSDRPDGYQELVRRYAPNPEIWFAADREFNRSGATMSTRQLFQLALDLIADQESFSEPVFIKNIIQIHEAVAGLKNLAALLAQYEVAMIAVTNGLTKVIGSILEYDGLGIATIGNWIDDERDPDGKRKLTFASPFGEAGMDKDAVAQAFVRAGYKVVLGAGDSKSDLGLVMAAVMSRGRALVRRGRSLVHMARTMLPPGSFWEYDWFDEDTLRWIKDALPRRSTREKDREAEAASGNDHGDDVID